MSSLVDYWCEDSVFIAAQQQSVLLFSQYDSLVDFQQIPKIIHFVWLGSELPPHCRDLIRRCQDLHPDWEIRIWKDEDVIALSNFQNEEIFQAADNFGMKSDIVRYEILLQYGGVYADVDYEFVRPLDDICSRCAFFAGRANTRAEVEINNGLIGSVPGHPILVDIVQQVKRNCAHMLLAKNTNSSSSNSSSSNGSTGDPFGGNSNPLLNSLFASFLTVEENQKLTAAVTDSFKDTIAHTGPGMLTRVMFRHFCTKKNEDTSSVIADGEDNDCHASQSSSNNSNSDTVHFDRVVVFDRDVFSPVPNTVSVDLADRSQDALAVIETHKARYVTGSTIAIHWWQKSWYKNTQ